MAYPVMTGIFRVQVSIGAPSGLPEDQFINTLYFEGEGLPTSAEAYAQRAIDLCNAFYGSVPTGAVAAIKDRIPNGLGPVTYKVYDLGFAAPRFPILEPQVATWVPGDTAAPLPREVACCLSFKGGPLATQRGRIYVGPLTQNSLNADNVDDFTRVQSTTMDILGRAATDLMNAGDDGSGPDMWWSVASPTTASTVRVNEAWVDNAFDTQRSRGKAPTSRVRFDDTGPIP